MTVDPDNLEQFQKQFQIPAEFVDYARRLMIYHDPENNPRFRKNRGSRSADCLRQDYMIF